jgi:hypothetical protein
VLFTADVQGRGFVVMAVYRPDPLLFKRQIASLLAQAETGWECLIGIDGQDPVTLDLVTGLVGSDARIRVRQYADNVGVYRHFERLLAELPADAGWVALADQDDVWHDTKLSRIIPFLEEPGVTAATCQARLVDVRGRLLGYTDRRPAGLLDLVLRNQVTGSLSVFSADVVRRAIPFPPATSAAVHDHWLAVCAAATGEVRWIDEVLQDYVQHASNVLGEDHATSLGSVLTSVRRVGVRDHLDMVSREQFGWRVGMARALDQQGPGVERVRVVAGGRLSGDLVRQVLSGWRRGRLRGRAAVALLAQAWWFGRVLPSNVVSEGG